MGQIRQVQPHRFLFAAIGGTGRGPPKDRRRGRQRFFDRNSGVFESVGSFEILYCSVSSRGPYSNSHHGSVTRCLWLTGDLLSSGFHPLANRRISIAAPPPIGEVGVIYFVQVIRISPPLKCPHLTTRPSFSFSAIVCAVL